MKENKLPAKRWAVLFVVCLICFVANFLQYQVSAWGPDVMKMLHSDAAGLSSMMLMPMLTAVFLSIPSGTLADRYGVKKIVTIGTIVSVIGAFVRCFTLGSMPMQLITMFMIGFGIACLNANLAKILGTWFAEQTGFAMGVFYAVSCVAIVVAQAGATLMGSLFISYMVGAIAMAVAFVLWMLMAKDAPEGAELPEPEPVMTYLGTAMKSKNVWFIALAYGLTLASTTGYATILPSALQISKGVSPQLAGSLAAVITVGSFFACIVGPAYCTKIGKNKAFLLITTVIGGVIMIVNWFVPMGLGMWVMLVLNGFFSALSGPIIQAMTPAIKEIGTKYAGSAGGVIGTVGLLLSYFLPLIVGKVAGDNWGLNLTIESVLFLLSFVPLALLPETGAKGKYVQEQLAEQQA